MILTLIFYSFIAAALTMFLNYCIGKPGSEKFSPYEIFSFYTVWICKRRLKQMGLYSMYEIQYVDNLERTHSAAEKATLKNDFKKVIYDAAEPFFTWERMIGMCPVCFGFWVSLIYGLCVTKDFVQVIVIVVISHIIIRLLSKIL